MSGITTKITGALSGDLVFIFVVFVIAFVCVMYFGKSRMVSFILAFYPATLLYNNFPFLNKFLLASGEVGLVVNKIVIFLTLFLFVNLAINKYVALYDVSSSTFRNGGLAIAILVLIILFSYSVINFDLLHNFSGAIDQLFQGTGRIFGWSLVPLLILWFI
jgi:hypothetical protein